MLYINRKQVGIDEIKAANPGSPEPLIMLKDALDKIESHGWPVKFKYRKGVITYNDKAKMKEGKKAVYFPREEIIQTKNGTYVVNWSDNAVPGPDGLPRFNDRSEVFKKTMICTPTEIERALWMLAFNAQVKQGLIIMEDLPAEAKSIANERATLASLTYFLYAETSPIVVDVEKMRKLAYAWGVVGANDMTLAQLQNGLYDRIQLMEQEKNTTFNIKSFAAAVTEEIGPFLQACELIVKCEEKGIISYDPRNFEYSIKSGRESFPILQIAATDVNRKKDVLARYLVSTPKKLDMLRVSLGEDSTTVEDKNLQQKQASSVDQGSFIKSLGPNTKWEDLTKEELSIAKKAAGLPAMTPNNILIDKLKEFYSR